MLSYVVNGEGQPLQMMLNIASHLKSCLETKIIESVRLTIIAVANGLL